jgi:hypothetical protein
MLSCKPLNFAIFCKMLRRLRVRMPLHFPRVSRPLHLPLPLHFPRVSMPLLHLPSAL